MTRLWMVLGSMAIALVLPPARWSLAWRIPVAFVLFVVAMACYLLDDLWRLARRLLPRDR